MKNQDNRPAGTLISYSVGFAVSVALTLLAFTMVSEGWMYGWSLVLAIMGLAVIQMLVQLILFLHLGHESKPRWKMYTFLFMLLTLLIVVVGSVWIMYNLNYNMMPDTQHVDKYLRNQEDT